MTDALLKILESQQNNERMKENRPWYFAVPFKEFPKNKNFQPSFSNSGNLFQPSIRVLNLLQDADIKNFDDLLAYDVGDMLKFRSFGKKSLIEITQTIPESYGGVLRHQAGDAELVEERLAVGKYFWAEQTELFKKYGKKSDVSSDMEGLASYPTAKTYLENINNMLDEAEGEVSYIKTIPENILDLTSNLKQQLEAQGYVVEAQLKITKPEQNKLG